ncbi:MAG: putative aldouronate transport system permease protein [Clostridiales bacterium]|jgi:putative aldouronate transport system permease protein|uniref:Carbohydrate ABC transporter membrane protein 1, CUT1 family n=1 Tax=Mahella australiensis (strain DSM 15567 / CIP 107919 / 50-1 BON) TaxID=697281 RepID=F4A1U1_MAHA5|nr:carbohydrate ABC transporter membrane protein 1, CUT1 family [Mahella australiensis 50-1 BON]MDI3508083.1 putative aldouronate transport system permease protein [Clostridiales bacterium]MDK2990781.1 putative aldouronate transport system permease protein [Clostridiales bacterium]
MGSSNKLDRGIGKNSTMRYAIRNYDLYIMLIPAILYFLIFHYLPMYGVQLAFKDFVATKGIWGSPWVGFKHFERFFNGYNFGRLMANTLGISLYSLAVGFPIPIILAIMMNELRNGVIKNTVQTITYAPHFLSTVVVAGMIISFLSPSNGIVNKLIVALGGQPIYFMIEPAWFKTIYVLSDVWQHMGWNSIIYMAALAGIDPELHEAAIVDGASRMKRIWHIDLPGIMPTVVILLILNVGSIMNVGFEKVFLLQNNLNMPASDVISTYVYRMGILGAQYSFSTAVGLFNSVINFILLIIVNTISRRVNDVSLW